MYTRQMFINDLEELIIVFKEEVQKREQGIVGNSDVDELRNVFLDEFYVLLEQAKSNSLPPRGKRQLESTWVALDQWDNSPDKQDIMSTKFFQLSQNYKHNLE